MCLVTVGRACSSCQDAQQPSSDPGVLLEPVPIPDLQNSWALRVRPQQVQECLDPLEKA